MKVKEIDLLILFKYFMLTKYSDRNTFEKSIEDKTHKYPLLAQIFLNDCYSIY